MNIHTFPMRSAKLSDVVAALRHEGHVVEYLKVADRSAYWKLVNEQIEADMLALHSSPTRNMVTGNGRNG